MAKPACQRHDEKIAQLERIVSMQSEQREEWIVRMRAIADRLYEVSNAPEWRKPEGLADIACDATALLVSMEGKR